MADVNKMDRTWLCSVLFMDIAQYSSQSVELQMKWKARFNAYLTDAIRDVPESERVILDTGDGAAICFLGAPEAAMFAALQLCGSFVLDEHEQPPGLRVRLGINLGPVKLVKDINGALNAIGDGINAGQRIMSFAAVNQILVSQSFFEVVSRVSDDYKPLFELKGVEKDKHVREHTVYHLTPPGTERRPHAVEHADGRAITAVHEIPSATAASLNRGPQGRSSSWLIGGAGALVVLAAVGVWRFSGSAAPEAPSTTATSVFQEQSSFQEQTGTPGSTTTPPPSPAPASKATASTAPVVAASGSDKSTLATRPDAAPAAKAKAAAAVATAKAANTPLAPPPETASPAASASVSAQAQAAYDEASRLLDDEKLAEAVLRFDDAIRASPGFVDAYVGRAEAHRMQEKYELSLEDCNQIIKIKSDDPRGYNCRGRTYQLLKQYDKALPDLDAALRLNPNFALAYDNRGDVYNSLQQYDRAVQDFNQAVRLRPRSTLFHMRRAVAFSGLKQYDRAIQDYTEVIRLEPQNTRAYVLRASAEDQSGDIAGAAADRRHVQEARKKKRE